MKLQRYGQTPILLPDPASDWECYNIFNPSVIYHDGLFHMHYRAQGLDWISRIGYAVSTDGIHWNRLRRPVLEPVDGSDSRGVEDPRVVEIEGVFYMTYTAYGREFHGPGEPTHAGGGILPMIAVSWCVARTTRIMCFSRARSTAATPRCTDAGRPSGWPGRTICAPGPKPTWRPSTARVRRMAGTA